MSHCDCHDSLGRITTMTKTETLRDNILPGLLDHNSPTLNGGWP